MARTRSMMAALAALAVTVTGVGVPVVAGTVTAAPAAAAVASEFSPGNIISDTLFFDGSAMSEGDVQSFLVAKRPTCTPGYTCLKDYVTATTNQPAEPGLCSAYTGRSAETAAQVIARVGQACGISQRVLLVLLQKEQGLVTSSAPGDSRYRSATGFGCPDGAPCDAQYYGFFNQVYRAARQFKRYAANPQSYSYRAGRVNTVKYHPSASCGTSQLYIENQATAGLYIYTPYRPNDSALANLYGTGDGCASYGNRNFWRDYTDWFGSTQNGADLVKTADDPTVWLLGVGTKHRVEDPVVLDSLAPLGAPAVVSRSVIDARPTGASLGRFFRGRDGSIWMFDKGWRFHATSCDLVADWGRTCDEYFSMQLTDRQLSRFVDGGPLSNSFSTAEGSWFVVDDGTRREVFDQASLDQGGVVTVNPRIHVREAAAAHLRVGAPVARPGVFVRDRAGGDGMLVLPSGRWTVGRVLDSQTRLGQLLPTRTFDTASIAAAGSASGRFTGTLQAPDGTRVVTTISGALRLPVGVLPALTGPAAPAEVVTALAPAEAGRVVFVRSATDGSLFLADGAQRRAVTTLATMETLAAGERATVVMVEQSALDAIGVGTPVLTPGQVVKAQDGPELYLVDGPSTLRHVPTFATMTELGRSSWTTVTRAQLTGYTVGTPALSTVLSCGGTTYVGVGGSLRRLSAGAASAAGLPTLTVDPSVCVGLPGSSVQVTGPVFVRSVGDATLYLASGGQRRAVSSMDTVYALSAGHPLTIVQLERSVLDSMPMAATPLTPGQVVKAQDGPELYLVDGPSTLRHVPTFATMTELGRSSWTTVTRAQLTGYTVGTPALSTVLSCGGTTYVGVGGSLRRLSAGAASAAGLPTLTVDPSVCVGLPGSSVQVTGPVFVRSVGDATLYLASGGQRRAVSSMDTVYALSAGHPLTIVQLERSVLDAMPAGPGV